MNTTSMNEENKDFVDIYPMIKSLLSTLGKGGGVIGIVRELKK